MNYDVAAHNTMKTLACTYMASNHSTCMHQSLPIRFQRKYIIIHDLICVKDCDHDNVIPPQFMSTITKQILPWYAPRV